MFIYCLVPINGSLCVLRACAYLNYINWCPVEILYYKRLHFLRLLKCSGIDHASLLTVFTICIRPVLEYGCQVWSCGITQYLSVEIDSKASFNNHPNYPIGNLWKLPYSQVYHKDDINFVHLALVK